MGRTKGAQESWQAQEEEELQRKRQRLGVRLRGVHEERGVGAEQGDREVTAVDRPEYPPEGREHRIRGWRISPRRSERSGGVEKPTPAIGEEQRSDRQQRR